LFLTEVAVDLVGVWRETEGLRFDEDYELPRVPRVEDREETGAAFFAKTLYWAVTVGFAAKAVLASCFFGSGSAKAGAIIGRRPKFL